MITILTDDGHGQETAGKRSPKDELGNFTKENSINRKVEKFFKEILAKDKRFVGISVAPEDTDVPLQERVIRANNIFKTTKQCIGISFHSNAMTGEWGAWEGIETLYYTTSKNSKRLAELVQNELLKGTKQKDRGIVPRDNLYILKKTNMPFILVELGFMDNKKELELLKSDVFLKECANEIYIGVLKYFNLEVIK